eukprot:14764174-Alexandrium_andersonii.AAC.1
MCIRDRAPNTAFDCLKLQTRTLGLRSQTTITSGVENVDNRSGSFGRRSERADPRSKCSGSGGATNASN